VILLDTHYALWVEMAPEKLSKRARARLQAAEDAGEALAISCMTLWEIAHKSARNQLELFVPCAQFLTELEADFAILPVDRGVVLKAASFSDAFPRDPSDRLIAGTAAAHDLTLMTEDRRILATGVCKTLW
jgi:PIN domain nuclease of toxin-antitoxin system